MSKLLTKILVQEVKFVCMNFICSNTTVQEECKKIKKSSNKRCSTAEAKKRVEIRMAKNSKKFKSKKKVV